MKLPVLSAARIGAGDPPESFQPSPSPSPPPPGADAPWQPSSSCISTAARAPDPRHVVPVGQQSRGPESGKQCLTHPRSPGTSAAIREADAHPPMGRPIFPFPAESKTWTGAA